MPSREELDREAQAWLAHMIEQGRRAPHAEFHEITPARARAMLERNTGNRNLRKLLVAKLRTDIQSGRWQVNGESMVFSREGLLNDGQHRLHAIAEAGRAVKLVVVFGVTRESRHTLDLGANRGPDDVLHFLGHHYATMLASTTRLVLAFEKSGGKNFGPRASLSKPEIVDRAHTDEALTESVQWASRAGLEIKHLIPASPLAFVHYVLTKVNPEGAAEYLRGLIEGVNLESGAPALVVRRYLFTLSSRSDREAMVAMVLRGWALFAQGRLAQAGEIHGRMPLPGIGLDVAALEVKEA